MGFLDAKWHSLWSLVHDTILPCIAVFMKNFQYTRFLEIKRELKHAPELSIGNILRRGLNPCTSKFRIMFFGCNRPPGRPDINEPKKSVKKLKNCREFRIKINGQKSSRLS